MKIKNNTYIYIFMLVMLIMVIFLYNYFNGIITIDDVKQNNVCQGVQLINYKDKNIKSVFLGKTFNEIYLSEQNNTYKRNIFWFEEIKVLDEMVKMSNEKENMYVLFKDGSVKKFIDNKCVDINGLPNYNWIDIASCNTYTAFLNSNGEVYIKNNLECYKVEYTTKIESI